MADLPLRSKTVLVRVDYNVPLTRDGKVDDDFRIRASLPTIKKLLSQGCKVVLISHLGRPNGRVNQKYSLEPAARRLAELLRKPVRFVSTCTGEKARMAVKRAPKVGVIMLENLRFHPEEEANDLEFAKELARVSNADYFIQDGFGVVHRAHASTSAIDGYLPGVAGLLLEREYMILTEAMRQPKKPLVAVLGGAKVSDKIPVIKALVPIADQIIIGGAMANTFLAYRGHAMGKSKVESGMNSVIDDIYRLVEQKVGKSQIDDFLLLPVDVSVGASTEANATKQEVSVDRVPPEMMALDIGPRSVQAIDRSIKKARTVIWNGTLGYAESPPFAQASSQLATMLAGRDDLVSIIGGGDTADFVINWDRRGGRSFTHVSTGGGASLELMSGAKLPGIESLLDAPH